MLAIPAPYLTSAVIAARSRHVWWLVVVSLIAVFNPMTLGMR